MDRRKIIHSSSKLKIHCLKYDYSICCRIATRRKYCNSQIIAFVVELQQDRRTVTAKLQQDGRTVTAKLQQDGVL
jgi:hypothetical protein